MLMPQNEQALLSKIRSLEEKVQHLENESRTNIYKTFFEASPDIIIQVDQNYKIILIRIPDLDPAKVETFPGKHILEIIPHHLKDTIQQALDKVFKEGQSINYETESDAMGKYRYYLNHLTPLKNKEGTVHSAYFISREITEQKISDKFRQESEHKLTALFNSSQHLHILMDKEQNMLWFNKRAMDTSVFVLGKALQAGAPMRDFLEGAYKETFDNYFNKVLTGEVVIYQRHYILENGSNFYLEMMLQPIYETGKEKISGISLVGVEVTERRQNEEKLEKINNELILHNQQLNQYSYVVSHNLRGPLVTLLGLANLFDQTKNDSNLQNEIINHIKKTTSDLDNIINDLNTVLSETNGTPLAKTSVNLNHKIQVVTDLLKNQIEAAEANITYDFEKAPRIYSVRSYIQSIFLNLLSNSLKYRKPEQPVNINIQSHIVGNTLYIEFKDDGLGMDLEKYGHNLYGFYKRFHTHVEGKGLGLYLVKTQVDLLGGSIDVESKPYQGTKFLIGIPYAVGSGQ